MYVKYQKDDERLKLEMHVQYLDTLQTKIYIQKLVDIYLKKGDM